MTTKKNAKTISLDQAEKAGETYTRETIALNQFQLQMNTKINKIKGEYAEVISTAKTRMQEAEETLQQFANEQRKHWDFKSYDLLHCTIGFRTSPAKVEKPERSTWESVTALVKKFFPKLVKEEVVVTLDKKAVVAASKNEQLFKKIQDKTGIDVVQDETFYVTAKTEELVS